MNATGILPLFVYGARFESRGFPIVVVWGNLELSRFFTLAAANAALIAEYYTNGSARSHGARTFAWDGESWQQPVI